MRQGRPHGIKLCGDGHHERSRRPRAARSTCGLATPEVAFSRGGRGHRTCGRFAVDIYAGDPERIGTRGAHLAARMGEWGRRTWDARAADEQFPDWTSMM